jgi:hypothetical protein
MDRFAVSSPAAAVLSPAAAAAVSLHVAFVTSAGCSAAIALAVHRHARSTT